MADFSGWGGFNWGNWGGLNTATTPTTPTTNAPPVGGLNAVSPTPATTNYNEIVNPILNSSTTNNAQKLSQLAATGLSADQISTASGLTPQQLQSTYGYTAPAVDNTAEITQNYQNLFDRCQLHTLCRSILFFA